MQDSAQFAEATFLVRKWGSTMVGRRPDVRLLQRPTAFCSTLTHLDLLRTLAAGVQFVCGLLFEHGKNRAFQSLSPSVGHWRKGAKSVSFLDVPCSLGYKEGRKQGKKD